MTRIIAGTYGGRRIQTPKGDGTRPTSDRVREAMFSSIESELGGFDGLSVLDLFAGSGALGFEALSRGAISATFVESDRRAAAVIQENRSYLGIRPVSIETMTVEAYLRRQDHDAFELVFIDPPYAVPTEDVTQIVRAAADGVASDALFVVERATRDPFVWPQGVEPLRSKKYGETTLWYGR